MKLLLVVLFLIPSFVFAQAPCTTTVNPDRTSVFNAVDIAADGDVICLNAGTVSYDSPLDISEGGTKAVEIRGAGNMPFPFGSAGQTIIHVNNTTAIFTGYETHNFSGVISNIRFTYDETSPILAPNGMVTWNRQTGIGSLKPWILHHNDFVITGRNDYGISVMVAAWGGVIYRNKFTAELLAPSYTNTNQEAIVHVITDDGSFWDTASSMGSADSADAFDLKNLYVENNYFNGFNVAADMQTSGRTVWRFNEMHNASHADHGYDSSSLGERHTEYYNNHYYCDGIIDLLSWMALRGGTGMTFNNTFDAFNDSLCNIGGGSSSAGSIQYSQFKLQQCTTMGGWPGQYPDNYPVAHQVGWGWVSGSNVTVGDSASEGQPGGSGFQQALEPIYLFNNTNSNFGYASIRTGYQGECRAMAYSNTGKTSGTTLAIPSGSAQEKPYWNIGQEAVVVFTDLVGGSTPTIADSLGNTWSALTGGTNSGMRLTAWHSHITTGGAPVITITFGSSSAARAGTLVVMRGMTASPLDTNPAVATDNATPYLGPSSGTLAQTNEIVLGYFGLNGPIDDTVSATSGDLRAMSCDLCAGTYNVGITGTTGSTAATNVTVGVTYRAVTATTAVQPSLTNSTANRDGISGTIAFKVTGNNVSNLDNQMTDFIQFDREIYKDNASFDGTSGTGSGTRAARPSTCTTGVAYWSTDQGSWNSLGADGVLDKCTSTNTWTNAWYVPKDYPHPLATVGDSSTIVSVTPSSGVQGNSVSFAIVGSRTAWVDGQTTASFSGGGITVTSTSCSSATACTANATISAGATTGLRDVIMTTVP